MDFKDFGFKCRIASHGETMFGNFPLFDLHLRTNTVTNTVNTFELLACDSICWARYMLSHVRTSVRLSVRPSHGWISRKRLNLGSCNFHHTVVPSLCCLRY